MYYGNSFNDITTDFDIYLAPSTGHTLDILPVGSSPVSAPRFSHWENGTETHFNYADSYDDAVSEVFTAYAWPGGYEVLYVTDGAIVCADCARDHWVETGIRLNSGTVGDNYGTGEYCGWCEAVIVERGCAECGTEEGDGFHEPLFVKSSGDAQICARCMAQHVVNGTAVKTGKGTYDVDLNGPWYGGGTYTTNP